MSPFFFGSVGYVSIRSVLAGGQIVTLFRSGGAVWAVLAQTLSDAALALFPLAYTSPSLRAALGWWPLPLFVFALVWEMWQIVAGMAEAEPDAGETQGGDPVTVAAREVAGGWRPLWHLLFVLPCVGAGGFLAFEVVAPDQWVFPSSLPAFRCEPAVLHPGDTLHLVMPRRHGAELGVYTPSGRFLYVVPFQAGSALPQNRGGSFAYQPSWTLRVAAGTASPSPDGAREPIFSDTGVYRFRISEEAELSASLMCSVRYLK